MMRLGLIAQLERRKPLRNKGLNRQVVKRSAAFQCDETDVAVGEEGSVAPVQQRLAIHGHTDAGRSNSGCQLVVSATVDSVINHAVKTPTEESWIANRELMSARHESHEFEVELVLIVENEPAK